MDIGRHLSTLQEHLASAARSGGPDVQEAADRLVTALEPALRLAFLELASELTDDITVKLDGDSVEVRLRGGRPEVVVERRPQPETAPQPPAPPAPPPPPEEGEAPARISLRLPESLKSRIDDAAAQQGVSVNTWIVRAAQRSLQAPQVPPVLHQGHRMTGWAR